MAAYAEPRGTHHFSRVEGATIRLFDNQPSADGDPSALIEICTPDLQSRIQALEAEIVAQIKADSHAGNPNFRKSTKLHGMYIQPEALAYGKGIYAQF